MRQAAWWMVLCVGCNGSSSTDSGTNDTNEPGSTEITVPYVEGVLALIDDGTRLPLEGVTATSALESAVSDADGLVVIKVEENQPFDVRLELSGYHPLHIQGLGSDDFSFLRTLALRSQVDALMDALGLDNDVDNLGIVTVSVNEVVGGNALGVLADVAVDLDASYALVWSYDPSGTSGILLDANETADPLGTVGFLEVAPGPATATVTPPAGYTCEAYPGGGAELQMQVHAGASSTGGFLCTASR